MAKRKKIDELQELLDQIQEWVDQNLKSTNTAADDEEEDGEGGIDRPKDPPKNP